MEALGEREVDERPRRLGRIALALVARIERKPELDGLVLDAAVEEHDIADVRPVAEDILF